MSRFLAYEDDSGLRVMAADVHGAWRNTVSFKAARLKREPSGLSLDYERWPQSRTSPAKKVLPLATISDLGEIKKLLGQRLDGVAAEVREDGLQLLASSAEEVEVASVWISVASQYLSVKKSATRHCTG